MFGKNFHYGVEKLPYDTYFLHLNNFRNKKSELVGKCHHKN